eukprot:TRINITY_DN330_c0_g1_i2.p1 TRINITY_DN330_c0_g1~~TRINITY_DN330_c0_g1_i2.p1  ORF type:complete len:827 (+),score=442.28 TRINITY_DN330_c0_g1_i2:98-2578(+)
MKQTHSSSFKWFLLGLFLVGLAVFPTITYVSADDAVASGPDPTLQANLKGGNVGSQTDAEVVQREEQAINSEGYSVAEMKQIREAAETHNFQAEVSRMMHIIINSLYSNRDIFLREVISNASDALDKIRFLSLTNSALLGEGDQAKLDIHIKIDKENNILHITDRGIGMTKDDMVKYLGSIAKSGTSDFMKKVSEAGDKASSNLIGQFGVGFYSIFLVADRVTVTSKNNEDDQYVWESNAEGSFTISKDPRGNTLGRGTRISLHLKDDAKEYLETSTIRNLAKKYSEFINFPIYLWETKEVEEEVPVEETKEDKDETEEDKSDEDVDVTEEDDETDDDTPKTQKVKKNVSEWDLLNTVKPIWTRSPKDITEEEYNNFYKAISKDTEDPLTYTHFNAEGEAEFKSILFFPATAPYNVFDPNPDVHRGNFKLFVRRVFITDDFQELVPNYLKFLRGIVDSDDLPLNVSRETLQKHKLLKLIEKKLVRKALAMIQSMFEKEKPEDETEDETEEKVKDPMASNVSEKYRQFWKQYGTNLKLGVMEDQTNKSRLIKLLLFHSSKTDDLASFDDYVGRMKEGQEEIYYLAGQNKDMVQKSPLIEKMLKRGYEVLYMLDPIDEYTLQQVPKVDGKYKLVNLGKEAPSIDDEFKEEEEKEKFLEEEFKPLAEFIKKQLPDKLEKVVISRRLTQSPCALVASSYGYTANMERVMKAQALQAGQRQQHVPKKILEVNPRHPIVREMLRRIEGNDSDETAKITAKVLYETAVLSSGYSIDDTADFASWIHKMMSVNLDIDPNQEVPEAPEPAPKKKKAAEDEEVNIDLEDHNDKDEL